MPSHKSSTEHPLLQAADDGDEAKIQQLLRSGADVNSAGVGGRVALHFATPYCRIVRILLRAKAYGDIADTFGWTPLHIAARDDREDTVRLLLSNEVSYQTPCSTDSYMWWVAPQVAIRVLSTVTGG